MVAPGAATAAEYYPPISWYSMLRMPQKSEFPVGGVKSQPEWLALWADRTDRITAGELPFAQPQRPQGIERNL